MKLDMTCPIEITKTEVLADDFGRCRGYIDIINVSEHPIRRIEGRAVWISDIGGELISSDVEFSGMKLIAHGRAQLTVPDDIPAAHSVEFRPYEIAFADFSRSWDSDDSDITEYRFVPAAPGPKLNRLRGIAGKDAVCYPEMRGQYWLCACGRLNYAAARVCVRCLRDRERLFAALEEGAERCAGAEWELFSKRLQRREQFRAKHAELRLQHERARQKKHERNIRIAVITLLGVLIILALVLIGILLGHIAF